MMMRNVAQAQRGLIVVIVCLAFIDVATLALLLSPAIRSSKSTQAELLALQAELAQKRIQAVPALDMDKKLAEARTQISDFYAHDFVSRYSEISEVLAKAAAESHVQLTNITYIPLKPAATEAKNAVDTKATAIDLTLDMMGNYESEIRFINALERSKMLLVIGSVNLAESQGGSIRLSLRMQTYLKAAES
jgi:Tfp pilus assembly protein PilO